MLSDGGCKFIFSVFVVLMLWAATNLVCVFFSGDLINSHSVDFSQLMQSEVASDGQYDKMNEKSELEKEKPETEKKIVKKPVMEEIFTFFTKVKLQVKVLEV